MDLYCPTVVVSSLRMTEIDEASGSSAKNTRLYSGSRARRPGTPVSWIQVSIEPAPDSSPKQSTGIVPATALCPALSSREPNHSPLGYGEVAQRTARGVQYAHGPYYCRTAVSARSASQEKSRRVCWYCGRGPVERGVYQVTTSMNCCSSIVKFVGPRTKAEKNSVFVPCWQEGASPRLQAGVWGLCCSRCRIRGYPNPPCLVWA